MFDTDGSVSVGSAELSGLVLPLLLCAGLLGTM